MNAIRDNFDSLEAKDQTTASNQLRILSDSMATRDAYLKEIDTITTTTKFDKIVLLDGSTALAKFNIGDV